jgi:hypothetical protein
MKCLEKGNSRFQYSMLATKKKRPLKIQNTFKHRLIIAYSSCSTICLKLCGLKRHINKQCEEMSSYKNTMIFITLTYEHISFVKRAENLIR